MKSIHLCGCPELFFFFRWFRVRFCFWQNPQYEQLEASLWFIHGMLELSFIWLLCPISAMQIWKQPSRAKWCRHLQKKSKKNKGGERGVKPSLWIWALQGRISLFFPPHKLFFSYLSVSSSPEILAPEFAVRHLGALQTRMWSFCIRLW